MARPGKVKGTQGLRLRPEDTRTPRGARDQGRDLAVAFNAVYYSSTQPDWDVFYNKGSGDMSWRGKGLSVSRCLSSSLVVNVDSSPIWL